MTQTASSRTGLRSFRAAARFASVAALFAGVIFFFASHGSISRASDKELSAKDRADVLEDVWRNVRDRYYDPAFHGINWDDVGNRYRPQVENVKSDAEFYALVNRMTGELHDAHTRFNTPEQWENRDKDIGVTIGFSATERDWPQVMQTART